LSLIVSLASGIRGAMAENADDGFVGWQFEREMLLTVESRIAFASYPDTTAFLAESFYEQSYNINVEVDNIKAAEALINGLDGYSLNANAWYGDYGGSAEYRRRVTIGDYARAKEVLRNLGAVSYETEYANKLADEVYDLEARLLAKEEEVGRLKALLAESRTMDVLAAVERRLGWVESERDDLRGRLNQLYDISSMPYLNISLTEKAPEVEPIPEDEFLDKLGQSFIRSFNGMVSFMESFVVWLIGALIPLLLVAAFVLIAVFVIRGKRRGRKGIGKEDRQ
ncbi:MAG: DUF4349 domain-containing protein, partial [Defluviitaleaceae bacterium]|nr:DUF4349 domain-containing protein [Defluviitaleaceae bacterium]